MKKKGLVLLVCLALVAIVGVNDTMANSVQGWFKDLSAWLGDALGKPDVNPQSLDVELVSAADGVLIPSHYADPFAWEKVNPVTHTTYVQNVADEAAFVEAAFVRICIAVKEDSVLKYQPPVGQGYVTRTISQKGYTVYTFDYADTLAAGAKTPDITMQVALTKETDNEALARIGTDFIKVQSFAIQASAFAKLDEQGKQIPDGDTTTPSMKPETALNSALGDRATFNPFN